MTTNEPTEMAMRIAKRLWWSFHITGDDENGEVPANPIDIARVIYNEMTTDELAKLEDCCK